MKTYPVTYIQKTDIADKKRFVEIELSEMLRIATDGNVSEAWYGIVGGSIEFVSIVAAKPGRSEFVMVEVNVTGDSPWAIVKDVASALSELYD